MKKYAVVTGASSGIGKQIALELDRRGFDLIISARREDRLEELKGVLRGDTVVITADLSVKEECIRLYEEASKYNVRVLINNAGFGLWGGFADSDLDRELDMIDLNCKAVHILTKLFLRDFKEKNHGYILNVASSAGLMNGGPDMAAYYATKSYVVMLTGAINEELRVSGSRVQVSALCPGPVDTEFNDVAGCRFSVGSISPERCAEAAVQGLFQRKMIIIPEKTLKVGTFMPRILPRRIVLAATGAMQKSKAK